MKSDQIDLPSFNEGDLNLGNRWLSAIHNEIKQVYLSDNKPWVIGYSGGKDSTTALQLVWYSLSSLPKTKFKKPVYVIASDTLVETPVIVDHIYNSLNALEIKANNLGLPIYTSRVKPILKETFWVNLIGKGYPIPYSRSRWCTDRLKIMPANRFILEKVAKHGEVLLILGVRKAESATRAQVINLHSIKGSILKRHTSLPGAFVYTPIVDFLTEDVWEYLIEVPSPWGTEHTNRELFNLYKSANAGECPLVIDNTTPSCGNSRFGCWVCTLVKKDVSMESLIQSGETWMKPLLKFRDTLSRLAEPEVKHLYRDHRRRDGKVYFKGDSKEIAWGQTRINKGLSNKAKELLRKEGFEVKETDKGLPQVLLRELLKVQLKIHEHITLISDAELEEIRRLWKSEQSDWTDQVPAIYYDVYGKHLDWVQDDISGFGKTEKDMLQKLCKENDLPLELLTELLDLEKQFYGMSRRSNIYKKIDKIFSKDWRTIEQIPT